MTRRIWKYRLELWPDQEVQVPDMSIPLHVGEQDGKLMLWVGVDDTRDRVGMKILIAGTGSEFDPKLSSYIGTAQMSNGFVWHVFFDSWVRPG